MAFPSRQQSLKNEYIAAIQLNPFKQEFQTILVGKWSLHIIAKLDKYKNCNLKLFKKKLGPVHVDIKLEYLQYPMADLKTSFCFSIRQACRSPDQKNCNWPLISVFILLIKQEGNKTNMYIQSLVQKLHTFFGLFISTDD